MYINIYGHNYIYTHIYLHICVFMHMYIFICTCTNVVQWQCVLPLCARGRAKRAVQDRVASSPLWPGSTHYIKWSALKMPAGVEKHHKPAPTHPLVHKHRPTHLILFLLHRFFPQTHLQSAHLWPTSSPPRPSPPITSRQRKPHTCRHKCPVWVASCFNSPLRSILSVIYKRKGRARL